MTCAKGTNFIPFCTKENTGKITQVVASPDFTSLTWSTCWQIQKKCLILGSARGHHSKTNSSQIAFKENLHFFFFFPPEKLRLEHFSEEAKCSSYVRG